MQVQVNDSQESVIMWLQTHIHKYLKQSCFYTKIMFIINSKSL